MTFGKGSHLHLIDGSAFIFRAYHALPPLTRKTDGLPVGAVAGFCNMLWKYLEEARGDEAPTHAAVVFDHSARTFRNEIYKDYKANRPDPPEDLRPQFPLTREATRAFNVACLEVEDFEADDIIAALACQARNAGGRVTIVSSDKDLMQLVGDGVEMLDPMKDKRIGREEVREKFGVYPEKVTDVQALAGDSIDNVPGAPGIGIKTAAQLIEEYGDLETLLARAGEIKQPKRRQTLIDHAENIRVSKRLVTLDCDSAPVDMTLESLELREPDPAKLLDFLAEMQFRTLANRVAQRFDAAPPKIEEPLPAPAAGATAATPAPELPPIDPAGYVTIRDTEALAPWLAAIAQQGEVAIDLQLDRLDELQAELIGIALSPGVGLGAYIPLGHNGGGDGLFGAAAEGQMARAAALAALRPMLEDAAVLKLGHDIKRDAKFLAREGIRLAPAGDVMLLSYALAGGAHGHGLDELAGLHLNHTRAPLKDLLGSGKSAVTFAALAPETAARPAAEEAEIVWRLWQRLRPQLPASRVTTVYETLERPLIPVLAQMESRGITIEPQQLSRMSGEFGQKLAGIEDEIYGIAGERFNIGSPKQLGEILFGKLGFAQGRKAGKSGALSTAVDVLEDLAAEGHVLPGRVLDWRAVSKLKATYTDALQTYVNPDTGRVHTSYAIAGASTGRLASTEPNLQNIPIRTEEGRRIREAFVAPEGRRIVSLDYSQIELRILAHVADIPALKQAFREGIDIHAMTASQMFGVPVERMDPETRRRAKAINFGVIYGISSFGLARNLRIPRAEAQAFIDTYFQRFPEIRDYMERTVEEAKRQGFVTTLFGRRIYVPGIESKGPAQAGARRQAINAPIQGAAADIIRRAMIRMPEAIAGLPAEMLLQVHDELVFEADEAAVEPLIERARAVMAGAAEPAVKLSVPLVVEGGAGRSWAAAH
ncbi:DNA polymerase I [Paracoccus sp. S-4012]|uniref:DNA polymerase I n=1 Tax=Paracoccus sp. S-4012 TaxID=2665648 RepID=UPI0012B1089D|nr:DNA polymerase I [Paracoccus sp. S-4012]MRX51726.1 DNA polymerase I [Paracoccus sp. S-4012]